MIARQGGRSLLWFALLGVVSLAVALAYSWTVRERPSASHLGGTAPWTEADVVAGVDRSRTVTPTAGTPDSASDAAGRSQVPPGAELRFWVGGAAGIEPERTEVSWSPLNNDVLGRWSTRAATIDLFLLDDRSRRIAEDASRARANGSGAVEILPPSALEQGKSVIWITHPHALPRLVELEATPETWPNGARFELSTAPAARVRVVDAQGNPVEGALVSRQALPATEFRPPVARTEQIAMRALARVATSGADGTAELVPFGCPQELRIEKGALRARLVLEQDPQELTVVLQPSFELHGSVGGDAVLGPWPTVLVDAFEEDGTPLGRLAALSIDEGRNFGPTQLPLDGDVGRLRFSLGNSDAHGVQWLPRPEPGSSRRVHLTASAGLAVWFEVLDAETREGVVGADVRLLDSWDGPSWERGTDERGLTYFTGVPGGAYHVEAVAPGYAIRRSAFDLNDGTAQRSWSIELARPGRIEGRVSDAGRPAARFRLSASAPDHRGMPLLHDVRASPDGAFVWDALQPGSYDVYAMVPGQRVSAVRQVRVAAGESISLELEILGTAEVQGRVVDAHTRAPVSGAAISVVLAGSEGPLDTLLDGMVSAPDGHFALQGVPLRSAQLVVSSPGHFPGWLTLPDLDALHDVGELALEPRYTIEYVLRGGDAVDPERYALRGAGGSAYLSFPPDGRLRLQREFEGNLVELQHPTGEVDSYTQMEETLRGGEIFLGVSDGPLFVEVVGGKEPRYLVDLRWRSPRIGWAVRTVSTDDTGVARTVGVPSDRVHVAIVEPGTFELLAVEQFPLDALGGGRVRVELDQGLFRLRVRDAEGRPIARASTALDGPDPNQEQWIPHARTNDDGECNLIAPPQRNGFLWVTDPGGARVVQRPVHTPEPGEVLDVLFDAARPLQVEVTSQAGPIPFADVALRAPRGPSQFFRGRTDANGRVSSLPVAGEPLLLEVNHAGHWRFSELVVPPAADVSVRAELRPLGSLDLRVVDAEGVPVVGAGVVLEHLDVRQHDALRGALGGDVGAWMGAGWLAPQSLVSDALGRVALEGLPEGEYDVRVDSAAGRAAGAARVGQGAGAAVFVVVP